MADLATEGDLAKEAIAPCGVVLMNTGTPDSPDPADIKPYLAEFLSDRRLIDMPRFIWLPILHGIILNTRPKKTSPAYRRIWTAEGSPFMIHSRAQEMLVQNALDARGLHAKAALAMRYGNPSLASALDALEQAGCTRVICLPLFPQTAFVTTESCKDRIAEEAARRPNLSIEVIEGYCSEPAWINAMAASIREAWQPKEGARLLFAFHSVPVSTVEAGDTYALQTRQSAESIARELGLPENAWAIAYQSRFDNRKWLQPSPLRVLEQWAAEGVRDVAIAAPGFATDCLESLRECAEEQTGHFIKACKDVCSGAARPVDGGSFGAAAAGSEAASEPHATYVPCLNARPDHIALIADLIERRI